MIIFDLIRFGCGLLSLIKGVSDEFLNPLMDFNFICVYRQFNAAWFTLITNNNKKQKKKT